MEATNSPKPSRRRARKADGKYQGDNPDTVTNEAWEPINLDQAVGKTDVKYAVKQKVDATSAASSGKYAKKGKVNPTFGKVTSTLN